ncbi:MAG: hypothetical protein LC642_03075, partial [Verrucomicrobiaceae bacterium]|nr:hypothetical protein [Verrucomicrobiaceae bacterium]
MSATYSVANAQVESASGVGGLSEVQLSSLTQQDTSVFGRQALELHPGEWKHAETEHFIYHFARAFVASRVAVEAEFYYRVIAKQLEREEPTRAPKSHIYIFDRDED